MFSQPVFFFTIVHRQVLCLTYVNTWCAQQTHPNQVGEEKQRIKWFLCDNSTDAMNHPFGQRKRNIIRHPLNSRQQSSVRLAYVASCKARGVVEGVRDEAWLMQPSPSDSIQGKTPYLALSYGSLSEAFYQACCDSPDNDNLMVSVKKGLPESWVKGRLQRLYGCSSTCQQTEDKLINSTNLDKGFTRYTLSETKMLSTWKWMLGIRAFPFGIA